MTAPERRWTGADRELVARAVHDHACMGDDCSWSEEPRACDLTEFAGFADAVLDALAAAGKLRDGCPCATGCDETDPEHVAYWQGYYHREREQATAGWRREADVRVEVAEEIADDIADNPGPDPSPAIPAWWSGWMESRDTAAAIARAHRTTPPTDRTEENQRG